MDIRLVNGESSLKRSVDEELKDADGILVRMVLDPWC